MIVAWAASAKALRPFLLARCNIAQRDGTASGRESPYFAVPSRHRIICNLGPRQAGPTNAIALEPTCPLCDSESANWPKGCACESDLVFGALVLIVVGTLFLLSNLGWMPNFGPLFHQWWPLILIVVGVYLLVQRS